jgi:hypothetical protein
MLLKHLKTLAHIATLNIYASYATSNKKIEKIVAEKMGSKKNF